MMYLIMSPRSEVIYGQVEADSGHDALLQVINSPERVLVDGRHARPVEAHPLAWMADGRWREVSPVGPRENGLVGGGIQASESYCRRFALAQADGTVAVLTYSWYAVNKTAVWVNNETPGESIERHGELIVCRDIRALEHSEWDDLVYENVDGYQPTQDGARQAAQDFDVAGVHWDGRPVCR